MMMQPALVVFCRHGESEGNVFSLKGGKPDRDLGIGTHKFALTERGIQQAHTRRTWVERYFPDGFDAYYVSEYLRSKQTHDVVHNGLPARIHEALNERDRGYPWLFTDEEMAERYPDELVAERLKGPYHHKPIGGESLSNMRLRIRSFLMWLSLYHAGQRVWVTGHGILMRHLYAVCTDCTEVPSRGYDNCEIEVYVPDERGMLRPYRPKEDERYDPIPRRTTD